ncbi:MAG TPA: S9 family peptidase [Acidimicrobiales bacterium]|nr:S9 family peptidase [Acidimicrobiales bacterium]
MPDNRPSDHSPRAAGPPAPERRPVELEAHGDVRVDDWYWLRDKDDPAVIAHLLAENAYTEAVMADTVGLQGALFDEIVARIEETDLSVPVRKGPWLYYGRTVEGRNYGIHCRRPADDVAADEGAVVGAGGGDAHGAVPEEEQVILDENLLAEGHDYFAVGNLSVSPDHAWLVYSTDTTGGERHTMRFRELSTGVESPESLEDTSYGVAWANDNATVFYVRVDEAMRPYRLWRHRVGTDPSTDVLVIEEPDDRFYLGVGRTKDDRFILCGLESKVTSEVRALSADDPQGEFTVIEPRHQGIEYSVDHDRGDAEGGRDSRFLIVTNDGAEDFRLMEAPDGAPGRAQWREVIPARPGVRLDTVDPFADHLVVYERGGGETRIRVIDASTGASTPVSQPESPSTVWGGANPEYDSMTLRYGYTSLTTPRSVYDLDLGTGEAVLRKRQPVLGDFDPARYRTARRWAVAEDGTEVPISLVYRPDLVPAPGAAGPEGSGGLEGSGGAPCLLYGYGSYEASMDPMFSSLRLSLLDRGFVYAIAHVRGGGEMGRRWYEDGKFAAKPNTFTDFVACARSLVADGWTSPDRLVARGGSAGGLLMGAVANLAPELFRAIVAEVPFVDCLTTILDETLPLTVLEWEEWGNPVVDPEIYSVIKSYSPYDNVRSVDEGGEPVRYPDILATAGLSDPRVGFWEPAKWVAMLRAANPENNVLLKTELGAGHGGPSGRYDAWRDEAFVYAFILDALGLTEQAPLP